MGGKIRIEMPSNDLETLEKALEVLDKLQQQTKGSLIQVDISLAMGSLREVVEKVKKYKIA